MVGELAHATNRDQKDMLLQLIGSPRIVKLDSVKDLWNYGEPYDSYPIDTGRLRRVVELVADKGGWGRSVPKDHGLGIAVHRSFVSYIATIVEVAVDDKRASSAFPGSIPRSIAGRSSILKGSSRRSKARRSWDSVSPNMARITFKDGKVQQRNFDDFPVIRMDESPLVTNTYIVQVDPDTPPSGVGEPGGPPFAPALINAIFAATGKRIRALPIGKQLET
jgi:isoquinoline 1-oxidoreductase beta subunit